MTTIICEECGAVNVPNFSTGCFHYPCNQLEEMISEREAIVVQDCDTEEERLEAYASYLLTKPRVEIHGILMRKEENGRPLRKLRAELNRLTNKAKRQANAKNNT